MYIYICVCTYIDMIYNDVYTYILLNINQRYLARVFDCVFLLQEAVNINQSLFVLRRVITALSRNADEHLG